MAMNGQPYSYSASNSGNGTPTPSSNSYPASLSSHSSRDTSPSRLHSNLNHIKSPPLSNNYPPSSNNYPPSSNNYPPSSNNYPPSSNSYPPSSNFPPSSNNYPPTSNNYPPSSNNFPPSSNNYPPSSNNYPPSSNNYPPSSNNYPPSSINYPPSSNNYPPSYKPPYDSNVNSLYQTNNSDVNSRASRYSVNPNSESPVETSLNSPSKQAPGQPRMPISSQPLPNPPIKTQTMPVQSQHIYNQKQFNSYVSNSRSDGVDDFPVENSSVPGSVINKNTGYGEGPLSYAQLTSSRQDGDQYEGLKAGGPSEPLSNATSLNYQSNSHPSASQSPLYQNPYPQSSPSLLDGYGLRLATSGQLIPPKPPHEEPLSSGPPRTNVLGIIPYSTESVSTMSQVPCGTTKTVPAQNPSLKSQPVGGGVSGGVFNAYNVGAGGAPSGGYSYGGAAQAPVPPRQPPPSAHPIAGYPAQYSSSRPPDAPYSAPLPNHNYNYQQNSMGGLYSQGGQLGGGYYPGGEDLANQMNQMSITQWGYNKLWQGREAVDLLKTRDILPPTKVEPPPIFLKQDYSESPNCSPEIFRCTLTRIPETKSLLDKSRLPLGVLIHPFMDLHKLSVITCNAIVRCHGCRTYINPFVYFVELKKWKCNLCFRKNDLPDEFQFDPDSKTYGDPTRRPEIKSATIEFIAPSEYMVRPPQPAAYVFVIDVSRLGNDAGYLQVFCDTLLRQLEDLPGDSRTSVGFITFDSVVHYYSLAETQSQPHQMVVVDIDDMFVPCPENLLVNLGECFGLVKDLLKELPNMYKEAHDTGSALGSALQAAYKLLAPTGGRITVFQSCLSNRGPGSLQNREDPAQRSAENVNQEMLNPVTDFYKKLALDCSGQQIAVDLFILNSQYVDLASLSGIAKFSGGCIHHFPLFNAKNPKHVESFQGSLSRYLSRKIGFESVMRLRCTRGLSIHSFHGNFFVRSTDLLSLPNINPDAGFGMQVSIDENLSDIQNVCFQAALLYTSSKGERRIRVHTLCLPIGTNLSDVLHSADQQCIAGLLAKMAVDRCHQSSLGDAREAFVNVVADVLSVFRLTQSSNPPTSLLAPPCLRLLPLYIHALLKYIAFRTGQSTRIDDRVFAMCQMKTLPLGQLIQAIYPDLYPIYNLQECEVKAIANEQEVVQPQRLHLSAERIDSQGIYLMDDGESIMIYVGHNASPALISSYFGVPSFNAINSNILELPELENPESKLLRGFVSYLQNEKPVAPSLHIIRDDNSQRQVFFEKLVEDKTASGPSYYEFLQRIKQMVK